MLDTLAELCKQRIIELRDQAQMTRSAFWADRNGPVPRRRDAPAHAVELASFADLCICDRGQIRGQVSG